MGIDPDVEKELAPIRDDVAVLKSQVTAIADTQTAHAKLLDELTTDTPTPNPDPEPTPTPDPTPTPNPDPDPPVGDVIPATSAADLNAALEDRAGGFTVLLEPGDYAGANLIRDFAAPVVIQSREPGGAVFPAGTAIGGSNLSLKAVEVAGNPSGAWGQILKVVNGSRNIGVEGCHIHGTDSNFSGYGLYAKEVAGLTLKNNYIHHCDIGITNFTVTDAVVVGNTIDWINSDSFKFSTMTRALIENNWGARNLPNDVDHQDFMQFQGANMSRDVVIRGNVFIPAKGTDATSQGIFFSEDNENVLIEQNIIVTGLPRGISVSGKSLVIRNNTVLHVPPPEGEFDYCEIVSKQYEVIENNVWAHTWKAGPNGSNYVVDCNNDGSEHAAKQMFTDFRGAGTPLVGLVPVSGSVIEGKGAWQRLQDLLAA